MDIGSRLIIRQEHAQAITQTPTAGNRIQASSRLYTLGQTCYTLALLLYVNMISVERDKASREALDGAFIDEVESALRRYGLRLPTLIGLEAGKPIAYLGGQLLWMAQPALGLFLPGVSVGRLARLLEEPSAVDELLARLEAET